MSNIYLSWSNRGVFIGMNAPILVIINPIINLYEAAKNYLLLILICIYLLAAVNILMSSLITSCA